MSALTADLWIPISQYRNKDDVVLVWRDGKWPVVAWRSGLSAWRMVGVERQPMPYIPTHFCRFDLPSGYRAGWRGSSPARTDP